MQEWERVQCLKTKGLEQKQERDTLGRVFHKGQKALGEQRTVTELKTETKYTTESDFSCLPNGLAELLGESF